MSLSLLLIFLFLLIIGAPVAAALGLSASLMVIMNNLPVSVLTQRAVNSLDSSPLLAVPLFILAANLLNAMGVTTHLFDLVRMLLGRIRGAVAQVSVLVALVFSGISGAALADIGGVGCHPDRADEGTGISRRLCCRIDDCCGHYWPHLSAFDSHHHLCQRSQCFGG